MNRHPYLMPLKKDHDAGKVTRREFLRTATLLGVSSATAYGMIGLVDPVSAADHMPKGGTLRVETTVYDIKSPATATTTADPMIFAQVVEHLTQTGTDNITRPHLLESWEPSADLKTWVLRVRQGVKWHDGRQFTADDVIWNLKRLLSDETGSSVLGLMKPYLLKEVDTGEKDDNGNAVIRHELWAENAIEKTDEMTVTLNLAEPQLAVPEHLYHYPAVMMDPEGGGIFDVDTVGTGAFRLTEMEVGRRAVIEAVDDYWGEGPYLDRVEFIDVGGNAQAIMNALLSGQVDGSFTVQPEFAAPLDARENLQRYEVVTADTAITRMNLNHKPFDDARVRKAFRLALDAPRAAEAAFGPFASPAEHHHVSPVHPEYAELPPMARDVEAAKALLAEAGYPDGVEVELTIQQNPPHHLRSATVMQEMWKDAGITCNINVVPNGQYWDVWTTAPLGTTVWAHRPLGVINLSLAYRSGASWNESAYANETFDELLTKAESFPDPRERSKVMADIQALLQEDGPIIQTYWRKLVTYYDKRVMGFAMHPTSQVFFNKMAIQSA